MPISGKSGKVKAGAAAITDLQNWKLDLGIDLKDVTDFDSSGWAEYISGIKNWSGSSEGFWNVATDTTGQKAIQDAWLNGTTVSITLSTNGTNNYTGSVFIESLSIETPVDDKVKFSFNYKGTAALTYA